MKRNLVPLALQASLTLVLSATTFAQKAPSTPKPTPTPALTQVAHDSTLTGQGTTAAPLAIAESGVSTSQVANGAITTDKVADGAITTSKLGAAAAPATGQVLTFNGAGLQWVTPSPSGFGGLRVIDSADREVGFISPVAQTTIFQVIVHRAATNSWLAIYADKNGFLNHTNLVRWYKSADCSGTEYVGVWDVGSVDDLIPVVSLSNGLVYVPNGPTESFFAGSLYDPGNNLGCQIANMGIQGSVPATIPISELGQLTPPFRVSR